MSSAFLPYGKSRIHYVYAGEGREWLVALHGYGQSAASFGFLEKHLRSHYRMLAIDLPFHGHTMWEEGRAFIVEDLVHIIHHLLHKLDAAVNRYTLLGYSMGGRLALSLTQHDAPKISKLVLIAPEGLKANVWQWVSTQTRAGNHLFKFTMKNPGWLLLLLRTAGRFRLVHRSLVAFTRHYLRNGKAREELFNRWTYLGKCTPQVNEITAIIGERRLPVRMLYGRYDRIISAAESLHLSRHAGKYCRLFIAEAGHRLLDEKQAGMITRLLTT